MLTQQEEREVHVLARAGYTITAIARHLGRDRSTIRAYLNGRRSTAARGHAPGALGPFVDRCRQRLADNPHLSAAALYADITALGYQRSYASFTRALRLLDLRPACPCTSPRHHPGHRDVPAPTRTPLGNLGEQKRRVPTAPLRPSTGSNTRNTPP
ncbi:helix-turn-helix domain-containing protein [Streptacidiphilus anmyonensis]|uniref:helix-turn-helix domain-containing protein n=1 Tax=Streptacidiphilus anmyonensis TaxID=405782 RepID=UPI001364D030|nr:helix-turn-helix domain-containing protein [Streptacidiphilus anmyonensis]